LLGGGVTGGCWLGGAEAVWLCPLLKVAVPFTPKADFDVTSALVPSFCGVSVHVASLIQPAFQVMVLPLIVAGFSAPANLTEVPAPLMENEILVIPTSPRLILPDQLPENLAGPVEAAF
jgi:hypothetical protein